MPLLERSAYPGPPAWQYNGHLQTVAPGVLRRVRGVDYTRERMDTDDGDFLDLDWIRQGSRRLAILTHGLEGDSRRQYILGTAKLFAREGYDVLAWNCRSCSGEMNRAFRMYHHGDTEDIGAVVRHALRENAYDELVMVGYSMGGNMTMKYLGVHGDRVPAEIRAAVAISAPTDLESGAEVLSRWDNTVYRRRFMRYLEKKIRHKNEQYPGRLDLDRLREVRRWRDFDEWFSAPICGFRDAAEFYFHASAKNFLAGIRRPTLLINAWNDPILTAACMPLDLTREHEFLYLETPREGGHCGFQVRNDEFTWAERRALEFSRIK
jgi:predicted alpha/beta-fold hydrolase